MKPTIPRTAEAWGLSVPVMTLKQARESRMFSLTLPVPRRDARLLEAAARQLNGIQCAAVFTKDGMELWRARS